MFNPSVVPFKRTSAQDAVTTGFTLAVRNRTLQPVALRPSLAPDRALFYGSVLLQASRGVALPLPSVAPNMTIHGYETLPRGVQLTFHRDSADNFYQVASYAGWTAAAAPARFALLVPDTLSPYSDFAVWSGDPNQDMDEMLAELDSVLALVDHLAQLAHLDLDRLHAFGFSDGGLFLGVAGLERADILATLTVTGYGWGGFYPMGPPPRLAPVLGPPVPPSVSSRL